MEYETPKEDDEEELAQAEALKEWGEVASTNPLEIKSASVKHVAQTILKDPDNPESGWASGIGWPE